MKGLATILFIVLGMLSSVDVGSCLAIDQTVCTSGGIFYHPNKKLKSCTLKDEVTINGVKCKQYGPVELYATGALKSCQTSDFYTYGSITCNQYAQVNFFPTGKLRSCDLSKQTLIDGTTCAQFEAIYLFGNGKLQSCSSPH
jgi:hypothetical protein